MTLLEAVDAALDDAANGRDLLPAADVVDALLDIRRAATAKRTRIENSDDPFLAIK